MAAAQEEGRPSLLVLLSVRGGALDKQRTMLSAAKLHVPLPIIHLLERFLVLRTPLLTAVISAGAAAKSQAITLTVFSALSVQPVRLRFCRAPPDGLLCTASPPGHRHEGLSRQFNC